MKAEEVEIKIDKQGRVCDKQGVPLRNRRMRTFGSAPFQGRPGTVKIPPKLEERLKSFEDQKGASNQARKKPGSNRK